MAGVVLGRVFATNILYVSSRLAYWYAVSVIPINLGTRGLNAYTVMLIAHPYPHASETIP